jgi:hypothetical protein
MKEPKTTTAAPSNGKKDSSHIGGATTESTRKRNLTKPAT